MSTTNLQINIKAHTLLFWPFFYKWQNLYDCLFDDNKFMLMFCLPYRFRSPDSYTFVMCSAIAYVNYMGFFHLHSPRSFSRLVVFYIFFDLWYLNFFMFITYANYIEAISVMMMWILSNFNIHIVHPITRWMYFLRTV